MPVKRRRSRHRRRQWEYEHRVALSSGQRYLGAFGSHREPWQLDEAREAWDDLGDEIMAEYRVMHPTLRPWGWWMFGPPGHEPPCGKAVQRRYLLQHGHLAPDEFEMIHADPSLLESTALEAWMGCR